MSFCDYFKQYIHDPADSIRDKHVFYRTDDWYDEVKNTEKELGITKKWSPLYKVYFKGKMIGHFFARK